MAEENELLGELVALAKRQAQELQQIRVKITEAINYIHDAESEVPEKYRRFINAFHDLHHVKYVYEEGGLDVPAYILRELERFDDRYRQILSELNAAGGTFDKVRREMASDPKNRWDHTKELPAPTHKLKEKPVETGTSE